MIYQYMQHKGGTLSFLLSFLTWKKDKENAEFEIFCFMHPPLLR